MTASALRLALGEDFVMGSGPITKSSAATGTVGESQYSLFELATRVQYSITRTFVASTNLDRCTTHELSVARVRHALKMMLTRDASQIHHPLGALGIHAILCLAINLERCADNNAVGRFEDALCGVVPHAGVGEHRHVGAGRLGLFQIGKAKGRAGPWSRDQRGFAAEKLGTLSTVGNRARAERRRKLGCQIRKDRDLVGTDRVAIRERRTWVGTKLAHVALVYADEHFAHEPCTNCATDSERRERIPEHVDANRAVHIGRDLTNHGGHGGRLLHRYHYAIRQVSLVAKQDGVDTCLLADLCIVARGLDDRTHTSSTIEGGRAGQREQVNNTDQRLTDAKDPLHCFVCEVTVHLGNRMGAARTPQPVPHSKAMTETVNLPAGAGSIDLADYPFEAGLVRLATVGAEGSPLDFSSPDVLAAVAGALTDDPYAPFSVDALQALAPAALAAFDAGLPEHDELRRIEQLWRPRLLALAGRQGELTGEQTVVLRFEERLRAIQQAMARAEAEGDEDRREALHARYIEIGTSYAGRLAARDH